MRNLQVAVVLVATMFANVSAFATHPPPPNCTDPLVGPTRSPNPNDPDITTTVVSRPTSGTLSLAGPFPQTNNVAYDVTLTPYRAHAETFDPVIFKATTKVVNGAIGYETDAGQNAEIVASSLPPACLLTAANAISCTFHNVVSTVSPNPAPSPTTFSFVVKTPTVGQKIRLTSQTLWKEPAESPGLCESEAELTTRTALTDPATNPGLVETFLPAPGTVTTGTIGGAATPAQPWVTIVKVPVAAQVGVDLTDATEQCPPGNCDFFSKIAIPGQHFGLGTHWYDPDAKSKLLVITLRKEVTTVDGPADPVKRALQILKEKIFYKPDGGQFQQVLLCLVTSGPTPGNPCIAYAQVYTKFNLPNVVNKSDYLGDHEWVIFANENGKYAQ